MFSLTESTAASDVWLWSSSSPVARFTEVIDAMDLTIDIVDSVLLFGWWNEFRRPAPQPQRTAPMLAGRYPRAQARSCRIDRSRWKRRRYVQKLRRKSRA